MIIPSLGIKKPTLSNVRTVVPTLYQTWSSLASCHCYEANTFYPLSPELSSQCAASPAGHRDYLGPKSQF